MKQYDKVKLKSDLYKSENVYPGMEGYLLEEYQDGKFEVEFSDPITGKTITFLVLGVDEIELAE